MRITIFQADGEWYAEVIQHQGADLEYGTVPDILEGPFDSIQDALRWVESEYYSWG